MSNMALYLADGIEQGRLDYKQVFSNPKLLGLKDDVDLMLIADGYGKKIVPI
ncbi:hypothetical protein [Sporosarcina saromensis]|nr:hypothetical protein [Sporosarcina saromensis]